MVFRNLILFLARQKAIERMVRNGRPFRNVTKRFIAGDTLEEALIIANELSSKGFLVTLDFLGENTTTKEEAINAKNVFIQMLERLATNSCGPKTNISIKLTQCGLDLGNEFAIANYHEVLEAAKRLDFFVRVDMEGSDYTERTIELVAHAYELFGNTGTVLQSYLRRTADDVEFMISKGIRTRIVKGAYLEPESIAFQEKPMVDEQYVKCAKRLLLEGNYPAIATHDPAIIAQIERFAQENKLEKSSFEFQMLYGIGRAQQDRLLAEGYPVRIYLPFGDAWYPYFTRRLAERPANLLFITKALFKR